MDLMATFHVTNHKANSLFLVDEYRVFGLFEVPTAREKRREDVIIDRFASFTNQESNLLVHCKHFGYYVSSNKNAKHIG